VKELTNLDGKYCFCDGRKNQNGSGAYAVVVWQVEEDKVRVIKRKGGYYKTILEVEKQAVQVALSELKIPRHHIFTDNLTVAKALGVQFLSIPNPAHKVLEYSFKYGDYGFKLTTTRSSNKNKKILSLALLGLADFLRR